MGHNHDDQLDRIIDNALSSYSEATPRPGLQQRVRNRIRLAEAGRRRSRFLRFAIGLATAMLLLALALGTRHRTAPEIPDVARAPSPTPETRPAREAPEHRHRLRVVAARHVLRTRSLPKEPLFPVVAPLTGAERALLALVEHYPVEAQKIVADMQRRSNEPIDVQAIEIQPLRSDGQQ